MARTHGRAPRGQRLRAAIPHGHWKTTTFVAGLRTNGMVAPMVLDGPINSEFSRAYVDQVLVPGLCPGDIVVMDNLGSQKLLAPACSTSRPTAPTSTPSRTPSPSSGPCCARQASAPSTGSCPPSDGSSTLSRRQNAPTTSPSQAMIQTDRLPLEPVKATRDLSADQSGMCCSGRPSIPWAGWPR